MSILNRRERRDYTGGTLTNPLGPSWAIPTNGSLGFVNGGYGYISPDSAMRHWAVWASVRTITDPISTFPINLYRRNDGGDPTEQPLPEKLRKPSAYATWTQWVDQVVMSLLLSGNAYGLIASLDRIGYPSQIDLLPPDHVTVEKKDQGPNKGELVYKIDGNIVPTQDMWHLPGPTMPGGVVGLSPIAYAARTIGLGLDAEKFGADYFRNGAHPTAVASTEQTISQDEAKVVKERIYRAVQNRELAVLGGGLKMAAWQVNPEESQFLDTQQKTAAEIAQIFKVPPEMIGVASAGSSLTYANREQRSVDFLNSAVNPWLARLEEAISAWFPRSMYVKFNTGALLRSDLLARYQSYQLGIANNVLMPSEARALEDLPTIPGLDDKPLPTKAPEPPPEPRSLPPESPEFHTHLYPVMNVSAPPAPVVHYRAEAQQITVNVPPNPEIPAPIVHNHNRMEVPVVNVEAPVVNVAAAETPEVRVNVEAAPPPDVTVNVPEFPEFPEQRAPVVNVTTPDVTVNVPEQQQPEVRVNVEPPAVRVDAPVVNVAAAEAPVVHNHIAPPKPVKRKVVRDKDGRIEGLEER